MAAPKDDQEGLTLTPEAEAIIASLKPIPKGTAASFRALAEEARERFGVMRVSSVEALRQAREEGTAD